MPFELRVETDSPRQLVRFRLLDEHGIQLDANPVRLTDHALWEGLFDTRGYVRRYQDSMRFEGEDGPAKAEELLERLGVSFGKEILGGEIMNALMGTSQRRTLLVRLPSAKDDKLAAAFARVPWEIARLGHGEPALMERGVVVRVVTEDTAQADQAVIAAAREVAAGEPLKVLLVFAEAPGSRPLAMRQEREQILRLFHNDIMPHRNVRVDVLCHGVTHASLQERISASNGYHIVHWSGHGRENMLELQGEGGSQDAITGEDLADLFVQAGGFIPQIVFLSACHSGAFVALPDWDTLRKALVGDSSGDERVGDRDFCRRR